MPKYSFLVDGVDPRLLDRPRGDLPKLKDGRYCRDRFAWGGITEPNNCGCVGECKYDQERKS